MQTAGSALGLREMQLSVPLGMRMMRTTYKVREVLEKGMAHSSSKGRGKLFGKGAKNEVQDLKDECFSHG